MLNISSNKWKNVYNITFKIALIPLILILEFIFKSNKLKTQDYQNKVSKQVM